MTDTTAAGSADEKGVKLPRRDYVLLPLISLLTVCLLIGFTGLAARRTFPLPAQAGDDCLVDDEATGARGIPNSVCLEKVPEGELTAYRFDSRGFRNDGELGPKLPGSYRIVLLGNSNVAGFRVPREKTFAALLPAELEGLTGRKIEVYNEAIPFRTLKVIDLDFDEALEVHPDLILWPLSPPELLNGSQMLLPVQQANGPSTGSRIRKWIIALLGLGDDRRLIQHFLYESQSLDVKNYLMDPTSDYLKTEPGEEWQIALQDFDKYAGDMAARAKAADVPFVVGVLPYRAHAAMISTGQWPNGYDPYKIDRELCAIVTRHNGIYLDSLSDFRDVPNPEQGYYPGDRHPNAEGQAIIARILSKELTTGAIPALRVGKQQAAMNRGR